MISKHLRGFHRKCGQILIKHFFSAFTSGSVESVSEVMEKEIIEKTLGRKSTEIATNTNTNRNTNERTPEIDPLRVGQPRILDPYAGGVGYDPLQGGQWPPPIGGADLGLNITIIMINI